MEEEFLPIGGETAPGSSNWIVVARRPPARSTRSDLQLDLSESVLLRWRREYDARGEAAFSAKRPLRNEALEARIARAGALVWQTRLENEILKKGLSRRHFRQRHTMIYEAKSRVPRGLTQGFVEVALVSRSWYYERPTPQQKARM